MSTIDGKTLAENSDALCIAARDGDIDEVRRLIPISDPSVYNYQPLTWAVYYRYTDILRELVPVSDIHRSGALQSLLEQTAVNGDVPSLKLLLSYHQSACSDVCFNKILTYAVDSENIEYLKTLLPLCDPKYNGSEALKHAIRYKRIQAIELLLPLSDSDGVNATSLLLDVVKNKNPHYTALLLPISNPKHNNSEALRIAASNNYIETVKLLIPVSDPQANNSQALLAAAENQAVECVRLLIPVSNPQANNSQALLAAVVSNNVDCVRMLVPVSDVGANCSQALVAAIEKNHGSRYYNEPFDNQIEQLLYDGSDLHSVWDQLETVNNRDYFALRFGKSKEEHDKINEEREQQKILDFSDLHYAIVARDQKILLERIALDSHTQTSVAVEQWRNTEQSSASDLDLEGGFSGETKRRKM